MQGTSDAVATREPFNPIDTNFDPSKHSAKDEIVVESPSLSSSNVLARFEFEPGRSKEGTKVLMLEWEDDEQSKTVKDDWEITWEGKRTTLPAKESPDGSGSEALNRLYFLLGPGVPIPTQVVLRKGSLTWKTNPLPAIFSPELGTTATQAGKKGVLHTIWAKKRLQVLQSEIESEEKENAESVGLEMAFAEREWIEQNFGVAPRPAGLNISTAALSSNLHHLNSPSSPRSPGGGRLMDKLRTLKLDTKGGGSDRSSLSATAGASAGGGGDDISRSNYHNPLSPESSDVAVGGFGSFAALKGMPESATSLGAKPPQPPQQQQNPTRFTAVRPPSSFAQQTGEMGSLNAVSSSAAIPGFSTANTASGPGDDDKEDDLFALPMSPRSPEMAKSPFSMLKG